jgi:hypothetical protein
LSNLKRSVMKTISSKPKRQLINVRKKCRRIKTSSSK